MPVTAAELAKKLNEHVEKYGDGPVMIYDDYSVNYKTLKESNISRMPSSRFVIECESVED